MGLAVMFFVGPEGQGDGDVIDINVEAYQDGIAVDLEDLNVSVGFAGTFLTFTNVSTGKWHATYTVTASDESSGLVSFFGNAMLGAATESIFDFYSVGGGGGGGSSWDLSTRIANIAAVGIAPAPGSSVVIEARSFNAGILAEAGQINFTVNWAEGMTTPGTPSPLTATKVQDGVYQATVQVPADLAKSRSYNVEAKLGSSVSSNAGFSSHPFIVMSLVEASTTTSATLKVFVGAATPVSGATISLSGQSITMTPPYLTTIGPFTATADANGMATLNPTWGAGGLSTIWTLDVTSGGKTTSTMVSFQTMPTGPTVFMPMPPNGFGCEAIAQVDTTQFKGGQTASMTFRVTNDGTAVASQTIARYAWRDGAMSSAAAGTVTTDATGNFTMTYVVPADWNFIEDSFQMKVFCNPDEYDLVYVAFGGSSNPFGDSNVDVTATGKLGEAVAITATYTGTNALTGVQAMAMIVPGNQTSIMGVGLAGGGFTTPLTRSGSTFTGSIVVPLWLGTGNYTVLVIMTNVGGTANQADETTEGGGEVIYLTPQGSTSQTTPPPPAKGFLPGFEGVAAVAAVAAIGSLLVVSRRRRQA